MAKSSVSVTAAAEMVGQIDLEQELIRSIERSVEEAQKSTEFVLKHRESLERALQKRLREAKTKADKKQIEKEMSELKKLQFLTEEELQAYRELQAEKDAKEELERQKKIREEIAEYTMSLEEKQEKERKEKREKMQKELASGVSSSLKRVLGTVANKLLNDLGNQVTSYMDIYAKYMSQVDARLQGRGSDFTYENINEVIRTNTALSPYVKYTAVLENLSSLVEAGITDNLTQRAFLMTISDKIATTFDAAESSLLEIIRIQQQDSTASRLGLEAELTKLFNGYFGDTSYLNQTFDAVQASLIDTSATLGAEAAVEFEYQVQKWLGSLGAVGVSSNTLANIAQGINYLGTGDVDSLSGNEALQNLLVMASSRVGLDYNKMLTKGISALEANTLLGSIVSFVQELSQERNNVVRKQYAELFGLTSADMIAFQNISESTLAGLSKAAMTYGDTLTSITDQLDEVGGRMHLSEKINNVIDNIWAATGTSLAGSPAGYGIWKVADLVEGITGGIDIPFVETMFGGIDLHATIEGLVKSGVVGTSLMVSLLSGLGSLITGSQGGLNLEKWATDWGKPGGYDGYQNAGELSTKKSTTNYVTSGSGTGIQQSVVDSGKQEAEEIQGSGSDEIESKAQQEAIIQVLQFLKDYFDNGGKVDTPLKVEIQKISAEASALGTSPFYTYSGGTL